jgi:hypothetical protein
MNLAIVSGMGWTLHRGAAETLLNRLAAGSAADTVLLDLDAVARETPGAGQPSPHVIPFAQWMKDARLAQEAINPEAILASAGAVPPERIVLVDARNYSIELIADALAKARVAWYPLERWHPLFALVADDINLLRLMPLLAATFYSQPQVLTEREVRQIVRALMRRAFICRWFGARAGRSLRWLERVLGALRGVHERLSDAIHNAPKG